MTRLRKSTAKTRDNAPAHFPSKPARVPLPQHESGFHPKRFFSSRRIFFKNPPGCRFPSVKAASTRKGFPHPHAFSAKTRAVFLALTHFPPKREPFSLSTCIFRQNARRFPCPDTFSAKTRAVLLASAYFPSKRAAFSLPRRIFRQNASRFPCPRAFLTKTRAVLPNGGFRRVNH